MGETSIQPQRGVEPGEARPQPAVTLIGAGLAGLAAGLALARAGIGATVIETRKKLGGRAGSFIDRATEQRIDNCQHVVMRSCTHLLDLYERMGVAGKIRWYDRFYFVDGAGRLDVLEADAVPGPMHLSRSMLGFSSLTVADKRAIARGVWAILRTGERGREALGQVSFADWLEEHQQTAGAVEKFWTPVIVSACNEWPARVAANHAIHVYQEGFLRNRHVHEMGVAKIPLQELYEPARQIIEAAGGRVLTGQSAAGFEFDGQRVVGVRLGDDQTVGGDYFVSTVPFDRLAKLVTSAMVEADARLADLDRFEVSPIIGIHLYFDSPGGQRTMMLPHVALTQSPLQWVFNKGVEDGKEHLHGVISAAHEWVDRPAETIAAMAEAEVRKALPAMRRVKLVHHRVIKEKRATFAPVPRIDRIRPGTTGAIENLLLAGDWTATGWPATMEGAVRSGYAAANAILPADEQVHVAPTDADGLYRWLCGS